MDDIAKLEHEARVSESWNSFFDAFQVHYEAVFKPRGISYESAIMMWKMNMIYNELTCECQCDEASEG